jgi:hypothetical protein
MSLACSRDDSFEEAAASGDCAFGMLPRSAAVEVAPCFAVDCSRCGIAVVDVSALVVVRCAEFPKYVTLGSTTEGSITECEVN